MMSNIKNMVKKSTLLYSTYKKIKFRNYFEKKAKMHLESNIQGKEKAIVILAGYKPVLWDNVFKRLKAFIPDDYDVCIVSSGKFSFELLEIAKKANWAYISTKRNNVCVALNTAIFNLKKAKYFIKVDEDIFLTKNAIKNIENAYMSPELRYNPGVVAPLIPINGFGFVEVLKRFQLMNQYETLFKETAVHAAGPEKKIESDPGVAKFFWETKSIDSMADELTRDKKSEIVCPIRFSIGLIFFERDLWQDMGYFRVDPRYNGMGRDEECLNKYCMINSRPIVVSKNAIVGHLSFGNQNKVMESFYKKNPQIFSL